MSQNLNRSPEVTRPLIGIFQKKEGILVTYIAMHFYIHERGPIPRIGVWRFYIHE